MSNGDAAASRQIRVVHVVAGISKSDGGPSYSVPALAAATKRSGLCSPVVKTLNGSNENPVAPSDAVEFKVYPTAATAFGRAVGMSSAMRTALQAETRDGSILHVHGLWLMPNIYPAWARRAEKNARLIHAPRGMLGPAALAISRWKKMLFWHVFQRAALETADCLHATALSEYEEIRSMGLANPVAILPNGIDLPKLTPRIPVSGKNTILSLGRVHPKKGLDRLLRAWSEVARDFPDWQLRIIGPAELDHDAELRQLVAKLGAERVAIEGAVYGDEKLTIIRNADLFVLPTLNENFAISVAEALASEVPVISTKGAPWSGLTTERCGWWIDHGVSPMAAALREAMALKQEERHAMGERGRRWMARDFSWDRIANDTIEVYKWLRSGGAPPQCVRMN